MIYYAKDLEIYLKVSYLMLSPTLALVFGGSGVVNCGDVSTTRVSDSPMIVTFSFFTDTVFSVTVTSASGAENDVKWSEYDFNVMYFETWNFYHYLCLCVRVPFHLNKLWRHILKLSTYELQQRWQCTLLFRQD